MKIKVSTDKRGQDKELEVPGNKISYSELLFVCGVEKASKVTYIRTAKGELKPGDELILTEGMKFIIEK